MSAGQKAARTRQFYLYEDKQLAHLTKTHFEILQLARRAATSAMARAQKEGVPFESSFNLGLGELLIKQDWRCALTNIRFRSERTSQGAGGRDYAPSPDRIDHLSGYRQDNVQWILWSINRAKGRMPPEHFEYVFRTLGEKLVKPQATPQS